MAQKMWFFKGDSLEEMTRTGSLRGLAQSIDVSKGSRNCPTDNDLNMDPICEPWCWNIYLQNWVILGKGKCWDSYSSTMVRIWGWEGSGAEDGSYSAA